MGPALVVLAAVCWGTGGLAGSLLSTGTGLDPVAVGAYRLVVAAVALLTVGAVRGTLGPLLAAVGAALAHRADAARLVGVGVGLAVFQACYFLAVDAVGVAVATLLTLGSAPLLVTVGARVLLGERAGARLALALPVAVVGLVLLVGPAELLAPQAGDAAAGRGALLSLLSAAGYAAVTLLGRTLSGRVPAEHVTTAGFVVAAAAALPAGLVVGMGFVPAAAPVALVLYLGVVPTAVAYALFFRGLRSTPSGVASVLTLAEPLTATLLAVLVLGEGLTVVQWTGAMSLCVTVLLLAAPARVARRS